MEERGVFLEAARQHDEIDDDGRGRDRVRRSFKLYSAMT